MTAVHRALVALAAGLAVGGLAFGLDAWVGGQASVRPSIVVGAIGAVGVFRRMERRGT